MNTAQFIASLIGAAIGNTLAWCLIYGIEARRKRPRDRVGNKSNTLDNPQSIQSVGPAETWRDYQIHLPKASNGTMVEVIRNFRTPNASYREPEVVRMVTLDTNPTTLSDDIAAAIVKASLIK